MQRQDTEEMEVHDRLPWFNLYSPREKIFCFLGYTFSNWVIAKEVGYQFAQRLSDFTPEHVVTIASNTGIGAAIGSGLAVAAVFVISKFTYSISISSDRENQIRLLAPQRLQETPEEKNRKERRRGETIIAGAAIAGGVLLGYSTYNSDVHFQNRRDPIHSELQRNENNQRAQTSKLILG